MRDFIRKKLKDPVSALTHMGGALAAIPTTVLLVIKGVLEMSVRQVVSFSIFGASLIMLYTASAVYHSLAISEKVSRILKRVDHMMIFVLIAGTYTPVCLVLLPRGWGITLLVIVWVCALAGVLMKLFWIDAPRWLSTALYVAMGWIVLVAAYPLVKSVTPALLVLLALGGVTYTLGAVIYAIKRPRINCQAFGFHEIFHLFVLGGSAFHVAFMFAM